MVMSERNFRGFPKVPTSPGLCRISVMSICTFVFYETFFDFLEKSNASSAGIVRLQQMILPVRNGRD